MADSIVTVVVPTLAGGAGLRRTLEALSRQSLRAAETIVVDNSGTGAAREACAGLAVRLVENTRNVGFGEAVNQGARAGSSRYVAALNDDARPDLACLERLVAALEADPSAGMASPAIVLASDPGKLDSAGLAIYPDGVAKQRGHGCEAERYAEPGEALLASGCAALYRRAMLDDSGWFDPDYFLYGEDTDVGLRGRWAGWRCLYAPAARVEHDYSGSVGRASRLKAFYVERNRLWTALKCFPAWLLPLVPLFSLWRYLNHLREGLAGRGLASEFGRGGENPLALVLIVFSAHWRTLLVLPDLWGKRKRVVKRIGAGDFISLLRRFRVSAAEVARQ